MNDLLVQLGKRIHELRATKQWSQEEFAHISGFHRTYVGQIERGEKNISFENLSKISGVLGVTLSELLAGLEAGVPPEGQPTRRSKPSGKKANDPAHRMFEIQKLARRLKIQHVAMDRTITALEDLAISGARPAPNQKQPIGGLRGNRMPNAR